MHFLRRQNLLGVHFPGVQNLAAQGQDGLELPVPRLFCRAASGITLHQEQFAARRILPGTIRQLARQGRTGSDPLAHHFLGGAQAALGITDAHVRQFFRLFGVLVQPQAEGVLGHAGNKRRRLPGGQSLLGLAGKLRLFQLGGQHVAAAIPDIIRGQLHPRGSRLRNSQNSRMASSRPVRMPLTWVPPRAVGIRLT